jgi:hypothetical protein
VHSPISTKEVPESCRAPGLPQRSRAIPSHRCPSDPTGLVQAWQTVVGRVRFEVQPVSVSGPALALSSVHLQAGRSPGVRGA